MQFFKAALELIFPPRCEVCRTLGADAMCSKCHSKILFLRPSAFIHSVASYEDPLKKAITRFKYNKKIALSKPLGSLMAGYIKNMFNPGKVDFLIPVPLHDKRKKERGFNQSELLASEISGELSVPVVSGALRRVKETVPQFDLAPRDRLKNVRGAFSAANASLLKDKNVILIDDIYTTGATAAECTKVLRGAGARDVHVLTLSRALDL